MVDVIYRGDAVPGLIGCDLWLGDCGIKREGLLSRRLSHWKALRDFTVKEWKVHADVDSDVLERWWFKVVDSEIGTRLYRYVAPLYGYIRVSIMLGWLWKQMLS